MLAFARAMPSPCPAPGRRRLQSSGRGLAVLAFRGFLRDFLGGALGLGDGLFRLFGCFLDDLLGGFLLARDPACAGLDAALDRLDRLLPRLDDRYLGTDDGIRHRVDYRVLRHRDLPFDCSEFPDHTIQEVAPRGLTPPPATSASTSPPRDPS